MKHDIFGQPTSLTTQQGIEDWNAVQLGFLAHAAATPGHLSAVLGAEPGFALGHAVKGLFYLLLGRRELFDTARDAYAAAEKAAGESDTSPRELLYVRALGHWLAGRPSQSVPSRLKQVNWMWGKL